LLTVRLSFTVTLQFVLTKKHTLTAARTIGHANSDTDSLLTRRQWLWIQNENHWEWVGMIIRSTFKY